MYVYDCKSSVSHLFFVLKELINLIYMHIFQVKAESLYMCSAVCLYEFSLMIESRVVKVSSSDGQYVEFFGFLFMAKTEGMCWSLQHFI